MSKIIGITAATPNGSENNVGVNVIFADSKEALPANVPTGTLGVVPSGGGGVGLPLIEIDDETLGFIAGAGADVEVPENLSTQLTIAYNRRLPAVVKMSVMSVVAVLRENTYVISYGGATIQFWLQTLGEDTRWVANAGVADE